MKELRPPHQGKGEVSLSRLSPDGKRLAYAVTGSRESGLYLADAGASEERKLVGFPEWQADDLAFSADGELIAYRIVADDPAGSDAQIGWVSVHERGELNRMNGLAFAWAAKGRVLYVLDPIGGGLSRIDFDKDTSRKLCEAFFHHAERYRPVVVPAPDGSRIAITARNLINETATVHVVERQDGELVSKQLTWIPGVDVHVLPFWSPKGVTLGLYLVHDERHKTGLVLVKGLEGDGEIFYERDEIDVAVTPAWAPDGDSIAFFRRGGALARLRLADRAVDEIARPDEVAGTRLTFAADGQLQVEGGAAVQTLPWPS